MTDLIDRIRAYVAAIPTHRCMLCDKEHARREKCLCPDCGAKMTPLVLPRDKPADALLREVAALEPVGSMQPSELIDDFIIPVVPGDIPVGTFLYTLTGATHD